MQTCKGVGIKLSNSSFILVGISNISTYECLKSEETCHKLIGYLKRKPSEVVLISNEHSANKLPHSEWLSARLMVT